MNHEYLAPKFPLLKERELGVTFVYNSLYSNGIFRGVFKDETNFKYMINLATQGMIKKFRDETNFIPLSLRRGARGEVLILSTITDIRILSPFRSLGFFPYIIFFSLSCLLYSCSEENNKPAVGSVLQISAYEKSVPRTAGGVDIYVTSNTGWTVEAKESWLKPDKTQGTGDMTVRIRFETSTESRRSGVVLFSGKGLELRELVITQSDLPLWALGEFVRPNITEPVISPDATTLFYCPMRRENVYWEESDSFNPGAVAKDNKIVVLYRAEDNSGQGIGKRTSRIGYAESEDGVQMTRDKAPVLYPADDLCKDYEWPGGCEDPRVVMTEDGLYVMLYTAWNRSVARLAVATSRDLKNWEKHGLAFGKAYNGRFQGLSCKSASILTSIKNGKITVEKVNGKYFMYWGERAVYAATSLDLINWEPVLDDRNELLVLVRPRPGYFDSNMTECGPPALLTDKGIVLMYNGRNSEGSTADFNYPQGSYCAGQVLFDAKDPYKVLDRLDKPFFYPEAEYEKSGQYAKGTVFIQGLVFLNDKLYLYYGCADSQIGVAICDYKL